MGEELEGLSSYFLEDMETVLPYNGKAGRYRIVIPIPGANYSEIPIEINLTEEYPESFPDLEISTHNLHPLEK